MYNGVLVHVCILYFEFCRLCFVKYFAITTPKNYFCLFLIYLQGFISSGWRNSPGFRHRLIYLVAAQFYIIMMSCEFVFVLTNQVSTSLNVLFSNKSRSLKHVLRRKRNNRFMEDMHYLIRFCSSN